MSCDSLFESSQLSFVESLHHVSGIHAQTSQFTPPKNRAGGGGKRGEKGKEKGEEKGKVGWEIFFFKG
jgi:hypothetical protein